VRILTFYSPYIMVELSFGDSNNCIQMHMTIELSSAGKSSLMRISYGVATISSLLQIVVLFGKRAL